ncbi:MAG: hypothetical protein ACR2PZ_06575 [Pseudomonadales bacterium]
MTVRQIIMFENSPGAMAHLTENYAARRKIDAELGNKSTVRYFTMQIAGPNSGTMSIQYEYDSLAQMEEEQNRRLGNPAWMEMNAALAAAGFNPSFHGVAFEDTPQ